MVLSSKVTANAVSSKWVHKKSQYAKIPPEQQARSNSNRKSYSCFYFSKYFGIEIKLGVVRTFAKIKPVKYHESWYILYLITHQATMKVGYINGMKYQL